MNKKLIHSLFFIVLLLFSALLATNLTFDYGKQIEDIDSQMEWHFFHEQFIHPSTAKEVLYKGEIVTLPHKFSEHYDTAKTYGTYIVKVTLPMQYVNEKIGLFIPFQYGNYDVYIQNELVLSKGDVSTTPNVLHMGPVIDNFTSTQREVYITLQLSNFSSMRGGFAQPLQIGEYESLLVKVVETLQRVIPSNALFARYGGEEFAILSDDVHFDYEHLGNAFKRPEELIIAADKQLYKAKHNGKNQFRFSID